ncbi:aspartic peptidase domain-containing protein [Lipomyces arxii]|uniref:aspartic peptidase domain-containing protein n=1 Tax=Lipomyces arxii TaxID=56418 RepID=UPI0034CE2AD8
MKFSFVSLSLIALASASPIIQHRSSSPGVVHFPIEGRTPKERFVRQKLRRRDANSTATMDIQNNIDKGAYLTNLTIGSPPQSVVVQVDTGSSDLWVQSSTNLGCTTSQNFCTLTRTFDSASSSTFDDLSEAFDITYADGTSASGVFCQDTLTFNDVTLNDFTFGLAENSSSSVGVFGIGYAANEVARNQYENLPELLVSEGVIGVKAYSLWLNDLDASNGNILFGGVDLAKFTGELVTVDTIPTFQDIFAHFMLSVTDVSVSNSTGQSTTVFSSDNLDNSITVILDSGTTYGILPADIVSGIASAIGSASFADDYNLYIVDCSLENSSEQVNITFNSAASLSIGLDQLVVPLEFNSAGNTLCALGVQPDSSGSSGPYLLGDAFLRSGYIVYDLDNNQISIAQAVFNTDDSDVVALNSTGVSRQAGSGRNGTSLAVSLKSSTLAVVAVAFMSAFLLG